MLFKTANKLNVYFRRKKCMWFIGFELKLFRHFEQVFNGDFLLHAQ